MSSALAIQWPAEAIWEAVSPSLPSFSVEILPQIASTNTELMRRARAGQTDPILLVAESQTAGRGRLGRDWLSLTPTLATACAALPPGAGVPCLERPGAAAALSSLTFSLGLPLNMVDWSGLSLAAGVSVANSLHPELQLKWPNDVWFHGRKLAGILIETVAMGSTRYAVIGVGLNIGPREATGLSTAPAWLQELLPGIDAPQALLRVAAPLVQAVQRFETQGLTPFLKIFAARDALAGRTVTLSDGTHGLAQGVDSSGALLVHTDAGPKKVSSAEVSVRPA